MKEIWKDVKDYKGIYQVSNLGNVRSLDRISSQNIFIKGKPIKSFDNGNGYLYVSLYNSGERQVMSIHRLVATAFIPNPNNLPQVNHKDECKNNNCANNLEWCTAVYNSNYRNHNTKLSMSQKRTPIIAIKNGSTLCRYFSSIKEAERILNINHSNISKVLDGTYKQCNGYKFIKTSLNIGEVNKNELK